MKEIRVGVVGFGFMGKTHTYGYKTIPLYYSNLPFKIKLVGVCDAVPEVARQAKESLDFEFATSNPDDIFSREDINVVDICTPNIYHKELVLKALEAGKNVYCDKPLAVSYEETKEITSVLDKYDAITQMALQYRFFPATMRARELIEEGRIGNIMSFRACYLHSGSVDPKKPIGWKQDKKFGGGGVLFDLGSHVLDIIYYLLGEYSSVFAETRIVYPERPDKDGNMVKIEADDVALMIVKMKNGGIGTIEASKIATGTDDELWFEIHGDKGAIRFNLMEPNWLEYYDNTLPEVPYGGLRGYTRIECVQRFKKPGGSFPSSKFSIGWIRSHVHCLYSFLSCVYEGRPASPSFKEGAYIQYVMEKAYESDLKKTWIEI
ncbi:MAG: Gfo/Idh/MocA family oxidoreductase [Clostridiaceae bacterium]|nr:Gfo/Idh/MocA family oxidoreductase [Clostridiaceae bacterium]